MSQGQVLVTDGPFSETKEWIAGFDILECDDLDEAIAIAARDPQTNCGKLEFRPVLDRRGLKVARPRPGRSPAVGGAEAPALLRSGTR
ncbi:MAG TPA: YciI family protein [Streptosporangiaceae bacterium]|nr:YciI family protein [Streptosporangiaceae bacterium]